MVTINDALKTFYIDDDMIIEDGDKIGLVMSKILTAVAKVNNGIPGRGYLSFLSVGAGEVWFTIPFGDIPEDKVEKYFALSQEKALRLYAHLKDGHKTSRESRNEALDHFSGAIYFEIDDEGVICSFSGMPDLLDESAMIILAEDYFGGEAKLEVQVDNRIKSSNEMYPKLLEAYS